MFTLKIAVSSFKCPPTSDGLVPRTSLLSRITLSSVLLAVLVFLPQIARGQVFDPLHPEVEAMVRKGVQYLEENPQGGTGESLLQALTVIEAIKRYDRLVPSDHPLVTRAVAKLMRDLEKYRKDGDNLGAGVYYSCVGILVLTELGGDIYQNEIETLVEIILKNRTQHGGFGYSANTNSDSSQGQYVALAFGVLKLHGFKVHKEEARALLEWFCKAQTNEGSWYYHYFGTSIAVRDPPIQRLSRHVTGASSIYLLGDILNLTPKRSGMKLKTGDASMLPPSVSLYVPPDRERDPDADQTGPLVNFDAGLLNNSKAKSNRWLAANWRMSLDEPWHYYFMYGLERYAYFREKAEGQVKEIPDWYDQGVYFLMANQLPSGGWPSSAGGGEENGNNSTCFAIMFLVRASELLMDGSATTMTRGGLGFQENVKIENKAGEVVSDDMVQGFQNIVNLLKDAKSEDDIEALMDVLAPAIKEFTSDKEKSKAEQLQFLRGLMTERSYAKRKVAVRFLAASQDMDNVPALLYALSDPALDIAESAHNGLRLISRKVDAFTLSDRPTKAEFMELKRKWTAWYKGVRPDARLIDE
ncbi:MAG: hypothetical protein KF851_12755 [Pirellulaceae bacterium]|jgi:hypothetical protein|nr:hypothetical protein [Pirellulaceae bacterium]